MPVQGTTRTGDGRANLTGGPLTILGIYMECNTCGEQVQRRSNTAPRRVMHGGWVALGAFGTTNRPNDHILWHKYLEFEAEWVKLSPSVVADFIEWSIPGDTFLGVTVNY